MLCRSFIDVCLRAFLLLSMSAIRQELRFSSLFSVLLMASAVKKTMWRGCPNQPRIIFTIWCK